MARLSFYGSLSDLAENADATPPEDVRDAAALIEWLAERNPALGEALRSPAVRIIVDNKVVPRDHPVTDADDIGFLPPFSGG